MLRVDDSALHAKTATLDLGPILTPAALLAPGEPQVNTMGQDHFSPEATGLPTILDYSLIEQSAPALESGAAVRISDVVNNRNRSVGAMLSNEISKRYGAVGLPDGTVQVKLNGHAGQSFGFTLAKGVTFASVAAAGPASADDDRGDKAAGPDGTPEDWEKAETFGELGVCEELCQACELLKWMKPTEIQKQTIPWALQGRDVIGLAETGSGKTAAFALPIVQRLLDNPQRFFAVVLSPTRELCVQIGEQFEAIGGDRKSVV